MPTDDIHAVLNSVLGARDAAECHGALAGMACGGGTVDELDWRRVMSSPEGENAPINDREALRALGEETTRAFKDDQMSFAPLLPSDSEPIDSRAQALQFWCRGFLYGFGVGFVPGEAAPLPDEAREVLGDFSEIARDQLDAKPGDEADERAYTEIVEYIRVGAQLVFETLHPANQSPPTTLH
jgi:yecA family protein